MDVPSRVHAIQGAEDRARVPPDGRFPKRSAGAAEHVAEGAPGDVLEEEVVELGAGGGVGGDVMAEAADEVRTAPEVGQHGLLVA